MPIAVVADVNTVTPKLWFVHNDHLDRPIMMTDGTKTKVWERVWCPNVKRMSDARPTTRGSHINTPPPA